MMSDYKKYLPALIVIGVGAIALAPFMFVSGISIPRFFAKKIVFQPITKDIKTIGVSSFIYDVSEKKDLYVEKADVEMPLASITKIMAAVVASELLPEDTRIAITSADIALPEEQGLVAGDPWKLKELLPFALITSSNDAFSAIAREFEVRQKISLPEAMNKKAQELGLTHTRFYNETGLDEAGGKNGGYSTCREASILLSYAYTKKKELFAKTAEETGVFYSESGKKYEATNTDILTARIPFLRAGKTGLTPLVGGNLIVLVEPHPQKQVIACVLGSTRDGRFSDIELLLTTLLSQTP